MRFLYFLDFLDDSEGHFWKSSSFFNVDFPFLSSRPTGVDCDKIHGCKKLNVQSQIKKKAWYISGRIVPGISLEISLQQVSRQFQPRPD